MPYSSTECKKEIQEWFSKQTDIKDIVDVGCGAGTYPKLLGDSYNWTGIEIWKPYVEEFELNKLYSTLLIGDYFDFVDKIGGDCIIFGDVLEHMEKNKAIEAIRLANAKFKHIVISIPIMMEQGYSHGNPFEEHKSVWTMEEINSYIPESFAVRGISWNIALFIK